MAYAGLFLFKEGRVYEEWSTRSDEQGMAKGDILLYWVASVDESAHMPRTSRASRGGFVYHILNRGNGRSDVFHQHDDFAAFVNLMREAHEKVPMRLQVLV